MTVRIIARLVPPEIEPTGLHWLVVVVGVGINVDEQLDPIVSSTSVFAHHLENVPAGHDVLKPVGGPRDDAALSNANARRRFALRLYPCCVAWRDEAPVLSARYGLGFDTSALKHKIFTTSAGPSLVYKFFHSQPSPISIADLARRASQFRRHQTQHTFRSR